MTTLTVGRTTISLPDLAGIQLSPVTALLGAGGTVQHFLFEDQQLRALELVDQHLQDGRIDRLEARSWELEGTSLGHVEITDSTVTELRWSGSKTRRTVFRGCRFMGAEISDVTLDDVLFDNCRFDYATFTKVRARGPVAFRQCVLTEAAFNGCDLTSAVMHSCVLDRTEFGPGIYRDLDLRASDLSTIRGTANLQHTILDHAQADQLTTALLRELEVRFGEDLEDLPR